MNHLFIGLGGTGGRILAAIRKLKYRRLRDTDPADTTLDYLFVDSDPRSFREDDPAWTVLGHSVQLPRRGQLLIAQANLASVIGDLNAFPNLKPWIGDREAWGEILASLGIDAAGGQKRRLGRFLFAMSARRFRDAAAQIVQDMQTRGGRSTDMTFHVFCGLAGGTGSGAVVDVVAQLRTMFPDPRHRILIYAYLPDLNPPAHWNTGNYHANAYAALLELNALASGAWVPFDVVGGGGPVPNPTEFWFNGCYVFTDNNDQGYRAAIDQDLPDIVADFVFSKSVSAQAWSGFGRVENFENGDASPEAAAGSRRGQRAVRFLSFGIRGIAFPEEAIREYLTYDFVGQALWQLNYNNWQDGAGYLDRARPRPDAEFVCDEKQREDWRLTDEHLRLSRPIIDTEGSRRWSAYGEEWQAWRANYQALAQQSEKLKWLGSLTTLFHTAWASNFRGAGVPGFFDIAGRDARTMALAIRDRVERSLFDDWRNGVRALSECGRAVGALLQDLGGRLIAVDEYVARRDASAADLLAQFGEIERTWGHLRILPGERERILDRAAFILREHYVARTLAEGGRFSKRLMGEVVTALTALKGAMDQAETVLAAAADQARRIVQARVPGEPGAAAPAFVTTVGDPKAIEATRRKLVLNQEEMRGHASAVRGAIAEALGQQPTFAALGLRLTQTDVKNLIVSTSAQTVASVHQRLITERSERVVGVSVIDKLRDAWGDSQARIDREVAALSRGAGRFVAFDESEVNKSYEGKGVTPRAVETFAVIMPGPPDQKAFVDRLKSAFKDARAGGQVEFIPSGETANEITLVALVNLFPLRFVRLVRGLKTAYEQRLREVGSARGVLEVHGEGDGSQFPDLFIRETGALADVLRPVLLLAGALGLVTRAGGTGPLRWARQDADGFDLDPVILGPDWPAAAAGASESVYEALRAAVAARLAKGDVSPEAAREAVLAIIAAVRSARGDKADDPVTTAWNAAGREAMKMVRGEAAP